MKTFLKEQNIFHYFSYGDRKSSIVERVNRTIQNIIYPLMHARKSKKWTNMLEDCLSIYHSRYHRTIKMSPNEAEKDENQEKLKETYRKKYDSVKAQKPKFKVGDIVRVQMQNKGKIKRREYLASFTEEKYKIREVLINLPIPRYLLETYDGQIIHGGTFYHWELSRVSAI